MMTHPGVNQYVADFVSLIRPILTKGSCRSVSLVVLSAQQRPLERFVFEVESLSDQSSSHVPLSIDGSNQTRACVQQHIRACLLKMHACGSMLSTNPPECTYSLSAEIHSESFPPDTEKQIDWVPAEYNHTTEGGSWANFVTLKTIQMDLFKVHTFILEAEKKGKGVL
ncbi:DNA-binding protein [Phycomyces blakesleeanus]